MKKQVIAACLSVMLFSVSVQAQLSIGVNGGYQGLKYKITDGKSSFMPGAGIEIGFTKTFSKHWGIVTGMGIARFATDATMNNGSIVSAYQIDDVGAGFDYRVKTKVYSETQRFIGLGIPVMLQFRTVKPDKAQWYFNAGAKFILPFDINVKAKAEQLNLMGYYPDVNLEINTELPQHGFGTVFNWQDNTKIMLKPVIAATAGTGFNFILKNGNRFIAGFFADYGLNDIRKSSTMPLVSYNAPISGGTKAGSVLTTTNAGKVNLFSAGIQLKMEITGQKKKGDKHSAKNTIDLTGLIPQQTNATDRDKDSIPDNIDACPCIAGSLCNQGCPDSDNDGVIDKEDKCPDIKGLVKYMGCPVPDSDKDGITDDEDKCPEIFGVPPYKGCPIPDADNDGINDEKDKCPKTPGPVENEGCPVIKKEVINKLNFAADNILFETNTATLKSSSFKGLDEVVKILNENEGIQLKISGHTDNVGGDEFNQELSTRRASAVLTYLTEKGAGIDRITSEGFGETRPVADNKTATGKQQNRRVELKLSYN
jgi:outer membrane protein OmpA-like peptidoglycan-associated protein